MITACRLHTCTAKYACHGQEKLAAQRAPASSQGFSCLQTASGCTRIVNMMADMSFKSRGGQQWHTATAALVSALLMLALVLTMVQPTQVSGQPALRDSPTVVDAVPSPSPSTELPAPPSPEGVSGSPPAPPVPSGPGAPPPPITYRPGQVCPPPCTALACGEGFCGCPGVAVDGSNCSAVCRCV